MLHIEWRLLYGILEAKIKKPVSTSETPEPLHWLPINLLTGCLKYVLDCRFLFIHVCTAFALRTDLYSFS